MAAGGQQRHQCAANQAMTPGYRNMHRKAPVWVWDFVLWGLFYQKSAVTLRSAFSVARQNSWQGRSF